MNLRKLIKSKKLCKLNPLGVFRIKSIFMNSFILSLFIYLFIIIIIIIIIILNDLKCLQLNEYDLYIKTIS